jgi:hypothetical protein
MKSTASGPTDLSSASGSPVASDPAMCVIGAA